MVNLALGYNSRGPSSIGPKTSPTARPKSSGFWSNRPLKGPINAKVDIHDQLRDSHPHSSVTAPEIHGGHMAIATPVAAAPIIHQELEEKIRLRQATYWHHRYGLRRIAARIAFWR